MLGDQATGLNHYLVEIERVERRILRDGERGQAWRGLDQVIRLSRGIRVMNFQYGENNGNSGTWRVTQADKGKKDKS